MERTRRFIPWARANRGRIILVFAFIGLALFSVQLDRAHGFGEAWIIRRAWWGRFLADFLIAVGPELAGIGIGVVSIDALNERRQDEQLKRQLTRDLLSGVRDFAVRAVNELRYYGWLEEVLDQSRSNMGGVQLDGAKLSGVHLEGADLSYSYLRGADLGGAHLEKASLMRAHLEQSHLWNTHLEEARLIEAHLEGASMFNAYLGGALLWSAHLEEAQLEGAHLDGADFEGAHLEGTNLWNARFEGAENLTIQQLEAAATLEGATMPDGVILRGPRNPDGPSFEAWCNQQPGPKPPGGFNRSLGSQLRSVMSEEEE